MRRKVPTIVFSSILVCCGTSADVVPSFQGLGYLAGYTASGATSVSADGSVVVGTASTAGAVEAFRWTAAEGMIGLGDLPGGNHRSLGNRVSADGSTVVGEGDTGQYHAYRWTAEEGMVDLGWFPGHPDISCACGVSGDGSIVVGRASTGSHSEAFRWTEDGGMVPLGSLPGGSSSSSALDISSDGCVIVGVASAAAGREAFRWTQSDGMLGLGDLPGGPHDSFGWPVSADGQVIVGGSDSSNGNEAFRWTEQAGMVGLGALWYYYGFGSSVAADANTDGSIIVGESVIDVYGNTAPFIWDEQHGMRNLQDVLVDDYGLDLTGWSLASALGISDDGTAIVGYGDGPDGRREAWVARVPEPSTLLLMTICALAMHRTRSRL